MPLAFQAVLLASDTGSRLYPLNSPATPKALLPIGNKEMLSFPLAMLEAGGVTDVLIVRFLCQPHLAVNIGCLPARCFHRYGVSAREAGGC